MSDEPTDGGSANQDPPADSDGPQSEPTDQTEPGEQPAVNSSGASDSSANGEIEGGIQDPPYRFGATLLRLGPGMIIAGSIVGSGELIMTTKTGAEAGFLLLWLILIGCVIKVFAQVEIGRYTLAWSETPLSAFNKVPGPRFRVNWIVWAWVLVTLTVLTQQGGIVGGIGQAMTIQFPLTAAGQEYNELQDKWIKKQVELGQLYKKYPKLQTTAVSIPVMLQLNKRIKDTQRAVADLEKKIDAAPDPNQKIELTMELGQKQSHLTVLKESDTRLRGQRLDILSDDEDEAEKLEAPFIKLEDQLFAMRAKMSDQSDPYDAYIWATILGIGTAILLYIGHYGFIQAFSTVLVGLFTLITVFTVIMLQLNPDWAVTGSELASGLSFSIPATTDPQIAELLNLPTPMFTALAAFGIIGVGATELILYPYWCLEKGYAQHTGPRDDSPEWAARAKGWMRVMRIDAWVSMVVYTFATLAFYLLGAAVLGRTGLNPGGKDLIRTLAEMYVPVFGQWAPVIFLFGAFAVLYSTYFVASAGNARMVADVMGLFGLTENNAKTRKRWTRILSAIWPLLAVAIFWIVGWWMKGQSPAAMVLAAGIGGAILLPIVGVGALWFRYRRCVDALKPGKLWDLMLWTSFIGFLIAGSFTGFKALMRFLG